MFGFLNKKNDICILKKTQFSEFSIILQNMTIREFSDIFLPTLAYRYKNYEMDFHSLVDVDTWKNIFPDSRTTYHDFLWYQIKLNSFTLSDGSGLIVYSLPEPNKASERKFIGIRFDNKTRNLLYYVLVRPKYYDATWEIHQYSFSSKKFIFECMINGTSSLRDFRNTIDSREFEQAKGFVEILKGKIKETFQMQ